MNTKLGTRASKSAKSGTDWAAAVTHRGLLLPAKKEQIALRVDADVINWFRSQGAGWQTRMNAVLKAYCNTVSQR